VESWTIPGETVLGCFVFAQGGRLLLAVDSGLVLFDPATGGLTPFANPDGGRAGMVYNDGKLDRSGRLWVGTYELTETEPRGILYCVPDGLTLYFSDSVGRRILAYELSPATRQLMGRRVFASFAADEGLPDGLTVDAESGLWCALYGGGRVLRFTPDGKRDLRYDLPCPITAAVAFGGPGMTTLFVATGQDDSGRTDGGAVFAATTSSWPGVSRPSFLPAAKGWPGQARP